MNVPENLRYTESHEWVRIEGDQVVVGITDFAQHELTDIVFVELPEVDREVTAKEACCVVESTKVAADIYSPVSGRISEVNRDLIDHPDWINNSPYEEGWLFRVALSDPAEVGNLKDPDQYGASIAES